MIILVVAPSRLWSHHQHQLQPAPTTPHHPQEMSQSLLLHQCHLLCHTRAKMQLRVLVALWRLHLVWWLLLHCSSLLPSRLNLSISFSTRQDWGSDGRRGNKANTPGTPNRLVSWRTLIADEKWWQVLLGSVHFSKTLQGVMYA
jgi:hypothetical protein